MTTNWRSLNRGALKWLILDRVPDEQEALRLWRNAFRNDPEIVEQLNALFEESPINP
jgi:hypothetical protein